MKDVIINTKQLVKEAKKGSIMSGQCDLDIIEKLEEHFGGRRWNTYNWDAPVSQEVEGYTLELENGMYIIAMKLHNGGDVRCNYDQYYTIMLFEDIETYIEISDDQEYKNSKVVTIDGDKYRVTPRFNFGELEAVREGDPAEEIIYLAPDGYSVEDVTECLKEALATLE